MALTTPGNVFTCHYTASAGGGMIHHVNNTSLLAFTVKWLAVKTASEMTYTVSCGALNSTQSNPSLRRFQS